MKLLPLAGLAAAASLSTLIAFDIVWNAHNPAQIGPWLDVEAYPYLVRITAVVHAGLYAILAAGLIRYGRVIDGGRKFVRVLRWILIAGYILFAVQFGWMIADPAANTTGGYAIATTVAFAISLLTPIVLGFALIRRREFRAPVVLLVAPLVLLPLTIALEAFSEWAHPGYTETAVNLGVALLCIAAAWPAREADPATRAAASTIHGVAAQNGRGVTVTGSD